MFDMGFAELLLVAIVGLLVIGPERLPGAIRTTMVWINRIRRSFDEVRADVQRELHNDAVMRELRESAETLKDKVDNLASPVKSELTALDHEMREGLASIDQTLNPPTNSGEAAKTADNRLATDSLRASAVEADAENASNADNERREAPLTEPTAVSKHEQALP
jgi:sec-independent protein translocase protein TatB